MKNFILLCAIVCCANGCPATISNLHKRLHEISMKVHCELSQWGDCDATCGEGIRSRNITIPAKHGGNECSEELTQPCNLKPCPVHCELSQWGDCDATCGEGIRSRNITIPAKHGGNECFEELTQPCNLKPCPGPINLIAGGYDGGYKGYKNDAQIVDLSSQTRSCYFPYYPIAMSYATGAIVSGTPIVCGGESTGYKYHSECYKYTTNSWKFLTNMSTKRWNSASVPVKGKLLVLGGKDGDRNRLATSEYVSPDGDASQPGPDLPGPRSSHCAVKLSNGQVMLLGGYPDENKKSAIIFHPDTEEFDQSLPSLTFGREKFGCATFNSPLHDNREVVLAVGGKYQATAEVLDYTQPNPAWTQITGLPTDYSNYFWGARAVTSASGQGAIVQYKEHFYKLTCEVSGCTWRILPNQLNPGVSDAVMMTLPSDFNAC